MKALTKTPTLWPIMLLSVITMTPWLVGCPKDPVPPQPATDAGPDPDPTVDAATPATCSNWCARAERLGCSSAKPTPNGASCTAVCENVQKSGVITWNLTCRIRARTCAAADACENAQ